MAERLTTGISQETFRQASQLEDLLRKRDAVAEALRDNGDGKLILVWQSHPYNNPVNPAEKRYRTLNDNVRRGLNKAAFGRYLDLVEGEERELALDCTP